MYDTIRLLHAGTAILTITGFLLRGFWMLTDSPLLHARLTRVLPHIIDTVFLVSGIVLVAMIGTVVIVQPWMLFKIAGLIAYIGLGVIALRPGRTAAVRTTTFVAALAVFAYSYGIAVAKSPASWLAVLAS